MIILLRFSNFFKENISSEKGVIQVKSTIEYISSINETILKSLNSNIHEEILAECLDFHYLTQNVNTFELIIEKINLYMNGEYLSIPKEIQE